MTHSEKWKLQSLSRVWLFATPWTAACQALLSMGFPRQEYWSGLPFPSPGDLPYPRIEPRSPKQKHFQMWNCSLISHNKPSFSFFRLPVSEPCLFVSLCNPGHLGKALPTIWSAWSHRPRALSFFFILCTFLVVFKMSVYKIHWLHFSAVLPRIGPLP